MPEKIRAIDSPDEKTWDELVRAHDGHLLQTRAWGELKSRFGWSAHRVAIETDGALSAGAQILFRRLAPGMTLAYVPRGPIAAPDDRGALSHILDATFALARSHGAFALKLEPNWLHASAVQLPEKLNIEPGTYMQLGTCIQPHSTIHLDLTRDHATILAEMKPKWRYNIRLAERKGITVREGNAKDLLHFYELLQVTSVRDAFPIHTFEYYRTAFELLTARDDARLLVAQYAGEMVAAIVVTAIGREAIYLYGASGNAQRERMPNHALHWHAIQWAKSRGCARYDLWGIGATAEAGTSHGLYQFKQGFGGELVQYTGATDVIFSRWKFSIYERALSARRGAMG